MTKKNAKAYVAIGLMSGTSLDGVDAALVRTDGQNLIEPLGFAYLPYPTEFHQALGKAARGDVPLTDLLRLERQLTEWHARAVELLLRETNIKPTDVDVIGFHGQTIRHIPGEGLTWQLGDCSYLAERCGIGVVGDMRRRDMAAGGEGAPLVPLFHDALFHDHERPLAILNIGGVANLTWLGENGELSAGDVGPGCGLLDRWAEKYTGVPRDTDGHLAKQGKADTKRVSAFLEQHPFYARPFPKSVDRYDFDAFPTYGLGPGDGAATLVNLTVASIAKAIDEMPAKPLHLYVCGGGAKNPAIMDGLKTLAPRVEDIGNAGFSVEALEAQCFAWLAVRHLLRLPLSMPGTTGAKLPTVGGVRTA